MSTPDNNFVIVAGNPNGELFLDDNRLDPSDPNKRRQLRQAGDFTVIQLDLGDIIPPPGITDTLKFSGAEYVEVRAGKVVGGFEDVIDINHSHHFKVWIGEAVSGGKYVNTLKGGSTDGEVHIALLSKHGIEMDLDLGNWSDQSKAKTTGIRYDVTCADTVKVRVLNADVPTLLNPSQRYDVYAPWWRSLFYPVYGLLKKSLHPMFS